MGRVYTIPIDAVAVSTTNVDLVSVKAGSHDLEILDFRIGQSNIGKDAGEDEWSLQFNKFGGGFTVGSNGAAITPAPNMTDDVAATFTARRADTFASTNAAGSYYLIEADAWNVRGPYRPTWIPSTTPKLRPGEGFALKLTKAPAAATNISGTLFVKEGA